MADTIIGFMKQLDIPNGLNAVGYTVDDIPQLVEGTLPQHRVIKIAPRTVGAEDLNEIFADAMRYW